jgi:hypothetical protein
VLPDEAFGAELILASRFSVLEIWLLIVLVPGIGRVVCLLSGSGRVVVPRCAPAPTAPGCASSPVAGLIRAGQMGAGRGHSRCQPVRNASFQGQSGSSSRCACGAGRAGRECARRLAERVWVGFPQLLVVAEAEEAGPGGQVGGDVRGDAPAAVDLPGFRGCAGPWPSRYGRHRSP